MKVHRKSSSKPMAAISAARKAAFSILMAVERGQSHSDDLLREREVNALSAPDRNLATALVLGVLRWQIQLDYEFQALLSHPDAKLDLEVLIALRLGAFQLLHMNRIPARAVIDESVELTKQSGHRFASGMVNAVLRKLAKTPQVEMARLVLKGHGFSRAKRQVKKEPALQATEEAIQDSTNIQDKISEAVKESLRNGTKCQGTTLVVPKMQSSCRKCNQMKAGL
jgi:transcription termination factor NusB